MPEIHMRVLNLSEQLMIMTSRGQLAWPYILQPSIQTIADSVAYVTSSYAKLQGLNLSDPVHPVSVPISPSLEFRESVLRDRILYTVGSQFRIFDLADPRKPQEVGNLDIFGQDLVLSGNRAYVLGSSKLHVVDIGDPAAPRLVGSYPFEGSVVHLALAGEMLYMPVAFFDLSYPYFPTREELAVWSIANPDQPQQVAAWAQLDISVYGQPIFAVNPYVYLALRNGGFAVLDASNPSNITAVSVLKGPDLYYSTGRLVGDRLYLAGDFLRVYDLSNPAYPAEIAAYNLPGWLSGQIGVFRKYVYAPGGSGVFVIGIDEPAAPITQQIQPAGDIFVVPGTGIRYLFPADTFPEQVVVQHRSRYLTDYQKFCASVGRRGG